MANNVVSGIGNTGVNGAAINLGLASSYIDIAHNSCLISSGEGRTLSISASAINNIRLINNIFVHTESLGYAMYVADENSIIEINNNNYFSQGTNFVYYGSNRANLAALQAVNSPAGNDANSLSVNPLYVSSQFLMPNSAFLSGAGMPFPRVTTDITATVRATPPDIGAYEFAPINADLGLIDANLNTGACLSSNHAMLVRIVNIFGSTIDFSVHPIMANWEVSGPVNSSGSVVFNTGTLSQGDTTSAIGLGIDLSIPGTYSVIVYLDTSMVNEVTINDTIKHIYNRNSLFEVTPQSAFIGNNVDSLEITMNSPFFITEGQVDAPFFGTITFGGNFFDVFAQVPLEITGFDVHNTTSGSVTYEIYYKSGSWVGFQGNASAWTSAGTYVVTSAGSNNPTHISLNAPISVISGTYAICVVSQNNLHRMGSGSAVGNLLASSSELDIFEGAGISTVPFSGNITSPRQFAGTIYYDLPNPVPPNISWTLHGNFVDSVATTTVGPWNVPGNYQYVASIQSPCGPLSDTVDVFVDFPFCYEPDSLTVSDGCDEVDVTWVSEPLVSVSTIEYGFTGFSPGAGITVNGVSSPATITGLTPGTNYDLYVIDSCAGYLQFSDDHSSVLGSSIPSTYHVSPTTTTLSSCAGILSVTIPLGLSIDSISVEYDITAGSGAVMSEQRSYVRCTSPGGTAEAGVSSGIGSMAGTFAYNRTLTIANGVVGGGAIDFELHNFRIWGGTGCDTGYNDVVANSFKVTIYTKDSIFTQIDQSISSVANFSTGIFPNAGNINHSHNGSGEFTFTTDSTAIGSLSWDFGDGNFASGASVIHQYATEGTYTVTLTADNNCGSDVVTTQLVYVGVDKFEFKNISIYPNPNNGMFVIDNLPRYGGNIVLTINDLQGRTIFTKYYDNGTQRIEINVEHLMSGTYHITLQNSRGRITKSVVVLR
ncbi:MAG: PKD domain-containing protein [Cryomorphaceae bacterium]|nr:PKD domain-containing protein [Cryomorphaceae bacterium]